ncbi:MAG: DUF554 domain-containing protein [Oscillospiraceae bacterium]|nr:DUF554 domain-containing protein [Oscillospiraceae bacterium]
MLGVFVNVATVILGSLIGLLCKKGIPERIEKAVMTAIGLCTVYLGIDGALAGDNVLVLILSMIVGTAIGTLLDLDGGISRLGSWIEKKFQKKSGHAVSVAEGFITASLLFCVGAMTIVGSLNSGLRGDHSLIFTKSLLDLFSSMMLSASLGIGVLCSAVFVLIFQGGFVLLSQVIAPVLTDAAIAEITCAGSLMILALGLNLLGIMKIKVANLLPAMFAAPFALALYEWAERLITSLV